MSGSAPSGTRLAGGYWLERFLGAGRFGSVYEATHDELGRVAVKCLHREEQSGPDLLARFEREAGLCQTLASPHIVKVLAHDVDPILGPFLVMRLLRGSDLGGWLARLGPLSPHVAVALARQICSGLRVAHAKGIVHRDLKPENVFLDDPGTGDLTAVVCDFGLAKICDATGAKTAAGGLTTTGALLGTPYYMAPEQVLDAKRVDAGADVWAVGMLLYHALAGKPALAHLRSFHELVRALALHADGNPKAAGFIAPLAQVTKGLPPGLAAVVDMTLQRVDQRPTIAALERALWAVFPKEPTIRTEDLVVALRSP
jgi:eukaryotic-like serine/threonine-protein kinase